jgi:branched-chain amino acid transport system substrate-binding protein
MKRLLWLLFVVACHPPATVTHSPELDGMGGDPTTSDALDDAARGDLDAAAQLLGAGDNAEARAAYDRAGTQHPAAEPYARVMSLAAGPISAQDAAQLTTIASDQDAPLDARRAAATYVALKLAEDGNNGKAATTMARLYPGQRPSWLVLPGDRATSMMLLAEGARMAGAHPRAAVALSWAFQLGDPDERLYARSRCAALLADVPDDALTALAENEDDFLRALGGAALVRRALAQSPAESELAATRQRLAAAAPALIRIDAAEEAEFLTARLAHAEGPRPLRIGVLLPLSGRARGVGARALGGVMLAQGGYGSSASARSTVLLEDTGSTPEGAAAGVERLHARGAIAIVGPLDDRESVAAAVAAQRLGLPLIALTLDTGVVDSGNMVFRTFVDSRGEVDALLTRAKQAGATRLGIAHPEGPLGRDLAEAAARAAEREGVTIVTTIAYDPALNNYANLAAKLRRKRVDAVFIPDVASRVSLILPFLAAEQLWCQPPGSSFPDGDERRAIVCLGNVLWQDKALLRDGGTYADGAQIVAGWSALAQTPANRQFVASHRGILGTDADVFAAFAYDALRLLRHVTLGLRKRSPAAVREALAELRGFPGLSGPVHAESTGEIRNDPTWVTVKDGAFAALPER